MMGRNMHTFEKDNGWIEHAVERSRSDLLSSGIKFDASC